jgi:hypothetical protein
VVAKFKPSKPADAPLATMRETKMVKPVICCTGKLLRTGIAETLGNASIPTATWGGDFALSPQSSHWPAAGVDTPRSTPGNATCPSNPSRWIGKFAAFLE